LKIDPVASISVCGAGDKASKYMRRFER